jgi:hypothetical protein
MFELCVLLMTLASIKRKDYSDNFVVMELQKSLLSSCNFSPETDADFG